MTWGEGAGGKVEGEMGDEILRAGEGRSGRR